MSPKDFLSDEERTHLTKLWTEWCENTPGVPVMHMDPMVFAGRVLDWERSLNVQHFADKQAEIRKLESMLVYVMTGKINLVQFVLDSWAQTGSIDTSTCLEYVSAHMEKAEGICNTPTLVEIVGPRIVDAFEFLVPDVAALRKLPDAMQMFCSIERAGFVELLSTAPKVTLVLPADALADVPFKAIQPFHDALIGIFAYVRKFPTHIKDTSTFVRGRANPHCAITLEIENKE